MSRSTNWCGLSPTSRRSTCGRETPLGCWWVVARFSSIALHDPAALRRPPLNGTQCSAPRRSGLRGRSRSHPTVRAWLAGRRSWGGSRRRRLRERTRPRWSPRPGAVGRLEGIRWHRPKILLTAVWSSSSVTETQYRGRRSAGSGVSSRQTGMILSPSSSRRMIAVSNSDLTHSDVLARSDQQTSTVSTVSKATPTLPGMESPGLSSHSSSQMSTPPNRSFVAKERTAGLSLWLWETNARTAAPCHPKDLGPDYRQDDVFASAFRHSDSGLGEQRSRRYRLLRCSPRPYWVASWAVRPRSWRGR